MKRLILCAAGLLAACTTPPTATETAQVLSGLQTLAQVAAANNSTAAQLVADGALLCAKAVSPTGVLINDGIVAVASLAGAPVSVVGALSNVVAASCPAGLVPGALPVAVSPDTVPVVAVQTELKAAS